MTDSNAKKPTGLVAYALGLVGRAAPPAAPATPSAAERLGSIPRAVFIADWLVDHEALCFALQHAAVRAAALPGNARLPAATVEIAHARLVEHARILVDMPRPVIVASNGYNFIPYERLAEARAKVTVLQAELESTRADLAAVLGLLNEVRLQFARDDGLQDNLLLRIDAALASMRGGAA